MNPIQQILDEVLARGRGSRVTLRLSSVLAVRYESLAPGVPSIAGPSSINLETQPVPVEIRKGNQVVQDDCAACFPEQPLFHEMLAAYGLPGAPMTAQIVTPLVQDGAVLGALSLHVLGGTRAWSAGDRAMCTDACARIAALLSAESATRRIAVDQTVRLRDAPGTGHNRWHPRLEPIARVRPGETLTLECRNGMDLVMTRPLTVADIAALDMGDPHPLTGPVYVEGAEPGDVLVVEIVALEAGSRGVTPIIPGFGALAEFFPEAYCLNWTLADGVARSPELPGVSVPAELFPGVIGVAPSPQRLAEFARREAELAARGGLVGDPAPDHALPAWATDGLRTIPPREVGGNMDTRGIVAGSTVWFPVDVPGALFSVGDLHFAQGDGEVCGTAIEMDGAITVRFRVEKSPTWRPRFPAYTTPAQPGRPEFATTGLPIRDDGGNEAMDLTLASRNALVELLGYLTATYGFTREAAYALMSAVCDLRISEIVDVPNVLVSAVIPTDIFE